MKCDARVFPVVVAAAAVLGVVSVSIAAAQPSTTTPVSPTKPSETTTPTWTTSTPKSPGSSSTPPGSTGNPEPNFKPTLEAVPPTAERGTQITVRGNGWPCDTVSIAPDWSAPVTRYIDQTSFDTSVEVPARAALGAHWISVTCDAGSSYLARRTSVEFIAAPVTTETTEPTTPPVTPTPVSPPATQPLTAAPPGGNDKRDNHIDDILGLSALLLAIGVATFVLRRRATRPTEPEHSQRLPQVRVQVVEDMSPAVRIREVARAPAVRVWVCVGEPQLHIREVPR
ncbi:hypothetical protein OG874_17100 [Nocardia sp. NBC_00565]|uniref:hypothetical protein n=1 Tax=Nocardia sp. NBC_00565 TaxID=2975993 RepID=UPI002E800E39|nr:hypothetical protein [Nocardia sp. NBC_00565]WUC06728.1 hypothetical protein OG874_17100 [Nocardia sp. NBC_00565]